MPRNYQGAGLSAINSRADELRFRGIQDWGEVSAPWRAPDVSWYLPIVLDVCSKRSLPCTRTSLFR
jgi:hypothetical protein